MKNASFLLNGKKKQPRVEFTQSLQSMLHLSNVLVIIFLYQQPNRLLARHGWRKVQPDTKHPKSDPVAQEDFKNWPKPWLPPV
ncbi:MAG: winged helix-turn-helix domain-containing protein [Proteobacteria bacterium]|nr:winged helix-turn-helix domain-containing protein [Pseudomonadota bacterium]